MFTNEFKDFYSNRRLDTRQQKRWRHYVHLVNFSMINSLVPIDARFLAIGPRVAQSLLVMKDPKGVVIDPYFRKEHVDSTTKVDFFYEFEDFNRDNTETFDYIILSFSIGGMEDILQSLIDLRRFCHPGTRIITTYYSRAWQPLVRAAEWLGLKSKSPEMNWVPIEDIENLMFLAGFQTIKRSMFCLVPVWIPLISNLINKYISTLPIISYAGLITLDLGRPVGIENNREHAVCPKVSVIVPARNEAGNIPEIVARIPRFKGGEEIIFVEGGSTDNTREAIKQAIKDHPMRDISFLTQEGRGKKNAVEKGFNNAKGDILAILDADITVPPESLTRFVEVLTSGKAEFINGSRMVYPMRGKAMRFLNLLANIFFSYVFSYLLSQRVRDTLCGTKVLWKKDYLQIIKNRSYFGDFDPFGDFDLLFGATHINIKIIDLPVRYEERRYGDTNIRRWRDGVYLIRMVFFGMRKLKYSWISFGIR